jgi:hypothetical protein
MDVGLDRVEIRLRVDGMEGLPRELAAGGGVEAWRAASVPDRPRTVAPLRFGSRSRSRSVTGASW